jgi:SAM-dependent methyltransferase
VRKGHKCVGVDFHGPTVAILREKAAECALDLEVIQGEIQKCLKDFHAGSFDVVLCLEVLMRCPDYREILGSFHRILKPGGLLMATFRSRFYLITTLLRQGKFAAAHQVVQQSEGLVRYARIPCYMNWHSLREIGELLAAGGFESLETVPIGRFSGTHYDGMAALVDVDQLIDEESRKALEFLECATIEDLGGIGRFLLAIARKAGGPVAVA